MRLIDPDNPIVLDIVKMHEAEWGLDNPRQLRVEPALMYDAVQLFARAFKQLKDSIEGDVKKLPCNDTINWEHGYSLSNFMRVVSWTRIIKSNPMGEKERIFDIPFLRIYISD